MDLIDTQIFGLIIAFVVVIAALVVAWLKRFPHDTMRRSTQKRKAPEILENHDQPTVRNRRRRPRAQIPPPHETTIPKAATAMIPSVGTPPPRPPTSKLGTHTPMAMPNLPTARAPIIQAKPTTSTPIAPTPPAKASTCTRRTPTHLVRAPTLPPMTRIQQQVNMVQQLAEQQGKNNQFLVSKPWKESMPSINCNRRGRATYMNAVAAFDLILASTKMCKVVRLSLPVSAVSEKYLLGNLNVATVFKYFA
ncbi:protein PRRC2A-like [Ruditapes philippinarum]|uniref:protein PRRC2A-like n=1 Tax=Ruditapes philippinarum TaxID=129788 RepID=UPI00295AFE7C|nr:protein PRRC2A-like [Ruditapes philippinarum]